MEGGISTEDLNRSDFSTTHTNIMPYTDIPHDNDCNHVIAIDIDSESITAGKDDETIANSDNSSFIFVENQTKISDLMVCQANGNDDTNILKQSCSSQPENTACRAKSTTGVFFHILYFCSFIVLLLVINTDAGVITESLSELALTNARGVRFESGNTSSIYPVCMFADM